MKTLTSALITCFLAVFALTAMSPAQAQPQLYFIHNDHLGTPQAVTDSNQQIVWRGRQQPFGQTEETTDTLPQNARFPGQYLDEESGLHYNYFRDYDPTTGRYIQSDPIGLSAGPNTYVYVVQNPNKYSDPKGLAAQACVANPGVCVTAVREAARRGAQALANLAGAAASQSNDNVIPFPEIPSMDETDDASDKQCEPDDEDPCEEWLKALRSERANIINLILTSSSLNEVALKRAVNEFNRSISSFTQSCPHLASLISRL